MILQLSHFALFIPIHPAHCLPPTFPTFSSCPWVIHISSLASTFPLLFLTASPAAPVYFLPTIYATYSLYHFLLSPPHTPCWWPSKWSPFLWFCFYSSCLLSLLLFLFCFLDLVVNSCVCCHYTVHIFYLLFLR